MLWGCQLLLCNLAEPTRCPPGRDLLALRMVPAGKEQIWRLLQHPHLHPFPPSSVSLCLWVFLPLTLHLSWCCSPNCLLLGIENRSLGLFQDDLCGMKDVGFWVSKGASGAASWAPAPSDRLDVYKTTLASTKLPSNWGSWELAVHRDVMGS